MIFSKKIRKNIVKTAGTVLLCLLLAVPCSAADFAVINPWVYVVAKFIAGADNNVRTIGSRRKADVIIAVDTKEGARYKRGQKVYLYKTLPMNEIQFRQAFYDPGQLPFIAQKIMNAMAEANKKRYPYYQRRLAEFQSRVDSTINVGRYLLADDTIVDLTGRTGVVIRPAAGTVILPSEKDRQEWKSGNTASLEKLIADAESQKWVILTDQWTAQNVLAIAQKSKNKMSIQEPPINDAIFQSMSDIYTAVDKKFKQISAPPPEPKQNKKKRNSFA